MSPVRGVLVLIILIAIASGIVWWGRTANQPPETPVVSFAERPIPNPLRILVTVPNAYTCTQGKCIPALNAPVQENAVTDGQWWYYYEEGESGKVFLRRRDSAGKTETIMESTPLTAPRGLFMSPDGKHVAFWLDNIAAPAEELTELWVYDVDDGGIRLLAEKLYRPDVRSDVHWNTAATYLWFVGDTGEQTARDDRLELILINTDSPGKRAAWGDVDWAAVMDAQALASVDLSARADQLVYPAASFLGNPILVTEEMEEHQPRHGRGQRTSIRGHLIYTQWLEDSSLLYALQDERGFTFWRVRDGVHRFVARRPGQLAAARNDSTGEQIAFVTGSHAALQIFSLHIATGQVREEGALPNTDGRVDLRYVEQLPRKTNNPTESATLPLADAELAAVIDKSMAAITGEGDSQPLRLIMTNEPNTVFLDYRQRDGVESRLQVKILDAVNVEWLIKARYETVNREWKKVQGGGLADPTPTRLYEWEESLRRWVLKENFNQGFKILN